jgi:glucosylceramidase
MRDAHRPSNALRGVVLVALVACLAGAGGGAACRAAALELAGTVVVPHAPTIAADLRYASPRGPTDGARVELFVVNAGTAAITLPPDAAITVGGTSPDRLVASGAWSWHDFPSQWPGEPLVLPPAGLTVLSLNAAGGGWGAGTVADVTIAGHGPLRLDAAPADAWISSITFLRRAAADGIEGVHPDTLVVHVENSSDRAWVIRDCRLWVPQPGGTHRALFAGDALEGSRPFPADGTIPPGQSGGLVVPVAGLPLSYAAVELRLRGPDGGGRSLWGHVRVKRERFAIGGGWVDSSLPSGRSLHSDDYLRTLRRLHVDCGMHGFVKGYTDDPARWALCPLEFMSACRPFEEYDTDAVLPRVHAVEFLGEPQYGGGRPVPPAEVREKLAPYRATRLPTSVTHSEERIWRHYAGLSDHPHFDAYRVCAPAADVWRKYDRWGGATVRWGAPLETVGDMARSLRELNRPGPIAAWSQGAADGWDPMGGRTRTSPTPDELVVQAWHVLAARITSLYWFNLSVKSLLAYRDLIEPIMLVDREALVLEPLMLEGAAGRHERMRRPDGRLDWDLSTICGPQGAVLFALDLDYRPDPERKEFAFGGSRDASWRFRLPGYLAGITDVFRIDADGVHDARWRRDGDAVVVDAQASRVAIHVAAIDAGLRGRLEARRRELIAEEQATGFDPAHDDAHFARLATLREPPAGTAREAAGAAAPAAGPVVQSAVSSADGSRSLAESEPIPLAERPAGALPLVEINLDDRGQSILGFGASFDHATCENLAKLTPERRREVVEKLFHPERGIGMNLMRVCIGTSDFTGVPYYTYDDVAPGETDPDLERFSIGKDSDQVLPAIRLAREANPDLLLYASPWSPPAWMKTSGKLGTGSLKREWHPAFARYLLEFVKAYEAEGLPIHALTVQNEPQMGHRDYPTTIWTAVEQRDFIRDHLGPLFEREQVATKIWCWDHNWNMPEFPATILGDPAAARFVDGTAFHHYEGRVAAQGQLHRQFPDKHIYFTEGSMFGVDGARSIVEILRNWSRSYNFWVVMLDEHRRPNRGPHSASATCLELLDDGTVRTNFDYFMYGQFMKFIPRDAVRVQSTEPDGGPRNVAFLTPGEEVVLVAVNTSWSQRRFAVACGDRGFVVTLPGSSVGTYRWPAGR